MQNKRGQTREPKSGCEKRGKLLLINKPSIVDIKNCQKNDWIQKKFLSHDFIMRLLREILQTSNASEVLNINILSMGS